MKKYIYPALIAITLSTSAFIGVNSLDWKVQDESYSVKMTSKKFDGIFKGLQASILFDEASPANSKISATIDANSCNTGNGVRNKHAGQALGGEQFPKIKFESTSVSKKGNSYEAIGKLTIKNTTKDIVLPFTFTPNATGGIFAGKFSVVPQQYDVTKSGTPELVEIHLTIPVTK